MDELIFNWVSFHFYIVINVNNNKYVVVTSPLGLDTLWYYQYLISICNIWRFNLDYMSDMCYTLQKIDIFFHLFGCFQRNKQLVYSLQSNEPL